MQFQMILITVDICVNIPAQGCSMDVSYVLDFNVNLLLIGVKVLGRWLAIKVKSPPVHVSNG